MLPPDAILELKIHQNAFAAGTSLRASLGELYSAPQTSFQGRPWGNGGERRNREGRAEGKERKKREGKGIVLLLPFYTLTSIYSTTVAYYRGIQCLENTYFTFFLNPKNVNFYVFFCFVACVFSNNGGVSVLFLTAPCGLLPHAVQCRIYIFVCGRCSMQNAGPLTRIRSK